MGVKTLEELNREFLQEIIKDSGARAPGTTKLSTQGKELPCAAGRQTPMADSPPRAEVRPSQAQATQHAQAAQQPAQPAQQAVQQAAQPAQQVAQQAVQPAQQVAQQAAQQAAQPPQPAQPQPAQAAKAKKPRSGLTVASDVLFYLAIFIILIFALNSGANGGPPRVVMGYSAFTVLSSSMQSEIPRGSLIFVKVADPRDIKVGDNITYMRDSSTSVTHKVTRIFENYQSSGARGFETKGVNNLNPDEDIIYSSAVVGKVVFTVPGAGGAIAYMNSNLHVVFIIFGLFMVLSFCLRSLFGRPKKCGAVQTA